MDFPRILKKRKGYIERIKPFMRKSVAKVLTGQRRVGKSFLLYQLIEEILGEEFYMTNPLVRYILLAILLLVLFLRTLSWLQYLYLKRELKKRFTKLV